MNAVVVITSAIPVWLTWLLLACITLPALAEPSQEYKPLLIEITSGRLDNSLEDVAASASVVDREQIHAARQQLGLDEALVTVPGVFTLNRYNFAQDLRLSIRGFGARANFGIRGVRILIDDIPATTPDGQSSVDDIELSSLERMEIIRGPSSALYGASAGGVLSMESERGSGPPRIETQIKGGAYDFRDYRLKTSGEYQRFAYALNLSRLSLDGYRQQSATERTLFNARFDYALASDGELTATLAVLDSPQAQDPGGLTAEQVIADPRQAAPLNLRFDTGESVRQQRVGLRLIQPLSDKEELRLRGFLVQRDFSNRLPFNAIELDRVFGGGGVEYLRNDKWLGTPGRVLLGIDLDYQNDQRQRRENLDGLKGQTTFDQRERVSGGGVFIAREQQLTTRLRLDIGLRYDWLRIAADDHFLSDGDDSATVRFSQWSPSIALLLHANTATQYYARIATGFETPTTTELAHPVGGGFDATLQSETSLSYEVGVRSRLSPLVRVEAAVFHIDIDDQLVPFEIDTAPGRFAFSNAGRSLNRGLEAALTLGKSTGWQLRSAYTYSDFRYVDFTDQSSAQLDGKQLPGIPTHQLNSELTYRNTTGIHAALETQYIGRYYADSGNDVEIVSYLVSGLRMGYQYTFKHGQINTFAGINNLFDKRYNANVRLNANAGRYFEPAPPRHGYAGVSISRDF